MNLKITFSVLLAMLLLSNVALAQDNSSDFAYHQKGSNTFNVGVGFPTPANIAATFLNNITNADAKSSPQFTFKHEYGLTDKIGIGIQAGYYTAETESINFSIDQVSDLFDELCCLLNPGDACCDETTTTTSGSSTYRINAFSVGARGTYHFIRLERLDTYSVISLAYSFIKTTSEGDLNPNFLGSNAPKFEYFAGLGARYYFNQKFALYGEAGNSILTPLHVNLGLTYRLR